MWYGSTGHRNIRASKADGISPSTGAKFANIFELCKS